VRIVGGEFRGRQLAAPESRDIRPSSDRLRETLFDILMHRYADHVRGARVLDLFAGSGALGLEAISRGAASALFVDDGVEARGLLRRNIEALGLTGRTKIFRRDAADLGKAGTVEPFRLVFADPPYGKGLGQSAASGGWLVPGAIAVLEEAAKAELPAVPGFEALDSRRVGDSNLTFFSFVGAPTKVQAPPPHP
jgi:16S rRNA (guanine966-N2)-methyltransferase